MYIGAPSLVAVMKRWELEGTLRSPMKTGGGGGGGADGCTHPGKYE